LNTFAFFVPLRFNCSFWKKRSVAVRTGGVRKVRWSRSGSGKQGGVRVIYYNRLADGRIWLLLIYAKSARDNLPAHVLNAALEMLDHAQD
jgi:hypothetical protein